MDKIKKGVSKSRFNMWRAIVAIIHADGVVTPHEVAFVQEATKDIGLSDGQINILSQDLQTPQDSYDMFSRIDDSRDKKDYFSLARAISWCDGDFNRQEALILKNLEKQHLNEEEMEMFSQSRDVMHEVELNQHQWRVAGEEPAKGIFSFLTRNKFQTA